MNELNKAYPLDEQAQQSLPSGGGLLTELSKKGYNYLKEGVLSEAESAFQDLIEIDLGNSYGLAGLGDVARRRGKHKLAIEFYQKCLALFPDNNAALLGLADCYKATNQVAKALLIWEDHLKVHDKNIAVLTRMADVYRKMRNFKKSKEAYLRVLAVEGDNAYALTGLGYLHYDFKDFREALVYWEKVYGANSSGADVRILTNLGNCHRKLKTYALGLPYFHQALALDQRNFYALFGAADCYRGMNQMEQSLEYWNYILEQDPVNKVILTRVGDALRQLGRLDEAKEKYQAALKVEFDVYAVLGLAIVHKEQGQYQEAIDSLSDILANDPNNPRIYSEIAECQQQSGDRDAARATLKLFYRRGLKNQQISAMLNQLDDD